MPPVETNFVMPLDAKKPRVNGAFVEQLELLQVTFVTSAACGPFWP